MKDVLNAPSVPAVPVSGVTSREDRIAKRADGGQPLPTTDTGAVSVLQVTTIDGT